MGVIGCVVSFIVGFMVAIMLDVWEPDLKEKENLNE